MYRRLLFILLVGMGMSYAEDSSTLRPVNELQSPDADGSVDDVLLESRKIDTITVKGSLLQGRILEFNANDLRFDLIYGKGDIRIAYKDIEQLHTEHEYNIYYQGKRTVGKIVAIKAHTWLVVQHGEDQVLVRIAHIDRFLLSTKENDSFYNKVHNLFPYSKGNIDIGMEYESGSNVKNKLSIASHLERKERMNRTSIDLVYSFEQTGTVETSQVTNKDELVLMFEQDYYLDSDRFLFGQSGYDYDRPRGVSGRIYPAVGAGQRLEKDRNRWVQAKVGLGAVIEKFVTYGSQQYSAAYFGLNGRYTTEGLFIVDKLTFDAEVFYMPSFRSISDHWLFRTKGSVALPIGESFALRYVIRHVNDDNPSPEVGNNKTTMDFYLSYVY